MYLDTLQKQKLLEIQKEVTNAGGDISLNQLIRDAIDVFLDYYKMQLWKDMCLRKLKE